ncbi:hypothetical protein EGW08_018747 [Elysia chlorotica]|uniref:Uncharacterized protein n=1 Tax=Elysia chlorotica TaxID=188477 RepID=A0A433SW06_ELYCH|nr:hypothetical protein EGW08_018747 [Elysia chlorotica]
MSGSSHSSRVSSTPSGTMDVQLLEEKMNEARSKFERACQQIVLLDQKIKDLEVRYRRAVRNKKNSFRYNLRLRLSVVTGVKMMYHHYASTKAEELARLRRQIPQAETGD